MHSSVSRKCEWGVAFGIHGVIGIMNGMECMTVLDLVYCLWVNGMYMLYAVGMRCMVGDVRCCTTRYIPCAVLESSCVLLLCEKMIQFQRPNVLPCDCDHLFCKRTSQHNHPSANVGSRF